MNLIAETLQEHVAAAIREKRYSDDPVCKAVVSCFNQLYYGIHGASQPWAHNTWMGVPILKCPEDLHVYQEILVDLRPHVIIECGVAFGGTTLWLLHMCQMMALLDTTILGIDVTLAHVACRKRLRDRGVLLTEGSSTDESVFLLSKVLVEEHCEPRALVILDSDHSRAHVARELELYAPLASYIIVEDTNVNGHPVAPHHGPGPYEAAQEFLAAHPEWERDVARERLLTFNPSGYLKRKTNP